MAVVESDKIITRKFTEGSITLIGTVDLEAQTTQLKNTDGTDLKIQSLSKATTANYDNIFTAYNTWVATQLT